MDKQVSFKREFSAGAVVYKESKFLLGKHSGYHKWVLPKGLIEPGEKGIDTAVRETQEEMGVKVKIIGTKPIHKETYFYVADLIKIKDQKSKIKSANQKSKIIRPASRVKKYSESGGNKVRVFKTVTFYLAEYVSGDPEDHDWEMSQAGWFDYHQARQKLAFEGEKKALEKAQKIIL